MFKLNFEWDIEKATLNEIKHGVSFEEAQAVFKDENHASFLTQTILSLKTDLSFWEWVRNLEFWLFLIVIESKIYS